MSNVPRCALQIEEVFREAGFPENLFRTVLVGPSAVSALIRDRRVRAVTLTGSDLAGSRVAEQAGREINTLDDDEPLCGTKKLLGQSPRSSMLRTKPTRFAWLTTHNSGWERRFGRGTANKRPDSRLKLRQAAFLSMKVSSPIRVSRSAVSNGPAMDENFPNTAFGSL